MIDQAFLELVRAGRTPSELAAEFEPSRETIRLWVKPAELDEGERNDGLTSAEKAELARLRKEVKRLRQENEQLKQSLADAILDRLVHSAYKLDLRGESMRKKAADLTTEPELV